MAENTFFGVVGQGLFELRGASDARLAAIETRLAAAEATIAQYTPQVAALVRMNAASMSVPNASTPKVLLDQVLHQTAPAFFRPATNDFLIPRDGLYVVSAHVYYADGTILTPIIYLDGVAVMHGIRGIADTGAFDAMESVYAEMNLNAGDVIDLRIDNLSGSGSATVYSGASAITRMTVRRVGPKL